ncbi:MAG: hypothetical protein K8T10_11725 [Candidatus Eremiobacteraeota bacterium]|nr:hypothetical protein [Candidatus Eremiobacteraeota bacterium]
MEIIREKLETPVSQRTSELLWEGLSKSYKPLLHEVRAENREKIGLDFMDGSLFYRGEIFFTESGQLLYYLASEDKESIEAGTILTTDEGKQIFSGFREKIRDTVLFDKSQLTSWEPVKLENRQFDLIREEAQTLEVDRMETEAAFVMKDDNLRHLLKEISEKGSCFQDELLKGENDHNTPSMLNQLEILGLISKEFFIFCRKTGQQISRIHSLDALEDARIHGFKCFNCGRLISEEKISPQVKCSKLGEKFSQANYWLALHLIYILEDMGINIEKIYYKTQKDNKVFDLFVNSYGHFFMFEIKDEPVKLEDVFMFLSRVNLFKPFRTILISSHPVPLDVHMYLKNYRGTPLTLVEGLDELEDYLIDCFRHKQEVYLEHLFKKFTGETGIDILQMFLEKFFAGREEIIVRRPKRISEKIADEVQEEVIEKMEEFTEVLPGEELEEIAQLTREMPAVAMETMEIEIEDLGIIEEEETELPQIHDEIPLEEPVEEEIPKPVSEEESEVAGEQGIEEMIEEEIHKVEEGDGLTMDFEVSLPTEILSIEEIPTVIDTSEEDLESRVEEILRIIETKGIVGNYSLLEDELKKIKEIDSISAAIVGTDGLIICSELNNNVDSLALSAYSSVIMQTISNTLDELGFKKAQSVYIEGITGRVRFFPVNGEIVVAYEERKTSEVEEEGGLLPGEVVLREAIMKKVLEDLVKIDGIMGSIIAGRDGLIIESHLPEMMDPEALGYLTNMVISENEKFLNAIQVGEFQQIHIKTPDILYNMIPIKSEAILTTCIESSSSREVLQSRLPHAALMITSALS